MAFQAATKLCIFAPFTAHYSMEQFFETYKSQLINAVIIIAAVFVLRFLTSVLHKWLLRVRKKRWENIKPTSFNLLKRLLNVLWIVLGLILLGFLSFGDSSEKFEANLKLSLYIGFISIFTIVLASSLNIWFRKNAERKIKKNEDPTVLRFGRYVAVSLIYIVGIMFILLAFPRLQGVAQTALGGAGIIALIAGVASQEALANLVGGIFIISFKPFKIGDTIKLSDNTVGTVFDITLRHTILRNGENKMVVIPNATINKEKIINYNLKELKICERIEIGISYNSDIDLAKKIMKEECEKHPFILDNRSAVDILNGKPVVRVALISLGDYAMTLRAWTWAKNNSQALEMHYDLLESIKKRFDKEGIEIPFPTTTITYAKEDDRKNFIKESRN